MEQLTLGKLLKVAKELKKQGITQNEIDDLQIYLGNDDELNGIHTAWFINYITGDNEDDAGLIEMINEDHHNIKLNGNAILIS